MNVVYPARKMDIDCVSPGKVVIVLHSANAPKENTNMKNPSN